MNDFIFGDCIEGMRDLPDGSVDMILTDLPYGTTNCAWDSIIPFTPLWAQYKRVAKPNAAVVLFAAQPFTTALIGSNPTMFKYLWYWVKPYSTGFTFAKYQPMRRVEDICVFYRRMPTYNPQGLRRIDKPIAKQKSYTPDSVYKSSTLLKPHQQLFTGYPRNVLEYNSDTRSNRDRLHPTQKPVALCEYLIRTYTNPGDTVLDSCAGSGTTAVAAVNAGRGYVCFESDKIYYDRAVSRLEAIKK